MLAPIVLFVYNRPSHTRQVLEALKKNTLAYESVLYIYADGPKTGESKDVLATVSETRAVIREKKWCKEVHIIESATNKGLADSIVGGVTEIVNRYGKIIVLEDDIVTSAGFLQYMNDALQVYEHEERVMHIAGYIPPIDNKLPQTFFYNQTSCWGWATWKRAWKYFDFDAQKLYNKLLKAGPKEISKFNIDNSYPFINDLESNIKGNMRTWAVRWHACVFLNKGFCLHPFPTIVQNIGFDDSGENCKESVIFDNFILAENIEVKEIPIIESLEARKSVSLFYNQNLNRSIQIKKVPATSLLKLKRLTRKIIKILTT